MLNRKCNKCGEPAHYKKYNNYLCLMHLKIENTKNKNYNKFIKGLN